MTVVVVVVGAVEQVILLAIVLSILDHLRFSYKPNDAVLVPDADGAWKERPLEQAAQAVPGLAVYRFGANLYYANANRFADQVRTLSLGRDGDAPRWICVDAEAFGDGVYVDLPAALAAFQAAGQAPAPA